MPDTSRDWYLKAQETAPSLFCMRMCIKKLDNSRTLQSQFCNQGMLQHAAGRQSDTPATRRMGVHMLVQGCSAMLMHKPCNQVIDNGIVYQGQTGCTLSILNVFSVSIGVSARPVRKPCTHIASANPVTYWTDASCHKFGKHSNTQTCSHTHLFMVARQLLAYYPPR